MPETWKVLGAGTDFRIHDESAENKVTKVPCKITSADGVSGCLIYIHGLNTFMFRVYDKEYNFVDYEINHNDLSITIHDSDAFFYQYEGGRSILDHSPATLGEPE